MAKGKKKAPDKLETVRTVLEILAYIASIAAAIWGIVKG